MLYYIVEPQQNEPRIAAPVQDVDNGDGGDQDEVQVDDLDIEDRPVPGKQANFTVQSAKFKVKIANLTVQISKLNFKLQSWNFKVQSAKFNLQTSQFKVQSPKLNLQTSLFKFQS